MLKHPLQELAECNAEINALTNALRVVSSTIGADIEQQLSLLRARKAQLLAEVNRS
jgi:hypothetical protein